jgi:hypothetical protein
MGGMNFFFNNVNYGASGPIFWNTNNALVFGTSTTTRVSVDRNVCNAILMGNYDRSCASVHYVNSVVNGGEFSITRIIISFANYYTDTINLSAGKLQVRLIKENGGSMRQWVEVGVISAPSSPGYSNNTTVTYPSGTQKVSGVTVNQDSDGRPIDSLKNSPWDITNGIQYLQVAGTQYATAFPPTGTTILYESEKTGRNWKFTANAYAPV